MAYLVSGYLNANRFFEVGGGSTIVSPAHVVATIPHSYALAAGVARA
jgi:hypothetical protein